MRSDLRREEGRRVVAAQFRELCVAATGNDTSARAFEVAGKQTAGQQHAAGERQRGGVSQKVGGGGIDAGAMRRVAHRLVAPIGGIHPA